MLIMALTWVGLKKIHSSHLRTVQVCGEHNDGVCQHVGSVCTGKQSLSVKEETYQATVSCCNSLMFGLFLIKWKLVKTKRKQKTPPHLCKKMSRSPCLIIIDLILGLTPGCTQDIEQQTSPSVCQSSGPHQAAWSLPGMLWEPTQSPAHRSPTGQHSSTSLLYWTWCSLPGTLQPGSVHRGKDVEGLLTWIKVFVAWEHSVINLNSLCNPSQCPVCPPGVGTVQCPRLWHPACPGPAGTGYLASASCWSCRETRGKHQC